MAKKRKKKEKKQYEEIDGIEYEVKNPLRKNLVKAYQDMVKNSHAEYVAKNRMMEKKRRYAENLLKNVERAPFVLGWLAWPEKEEDDGLTKGSKKKKTPVNKRTKKGSKSDAIKKPTAPKKPKKPTAPKKPASPKKPTIKSKKK